MAHARRPWPHPSRRKREPAVEYDEVAELLEKVRDLRLMLTADLSAAASALDADHPEVARDIVAADSVEVRRVAALPRPAPSPAPSPSRRRRAMLVLPAIPLVGALAITGAAALNSSPHHHHDQAVVTSLANGPGPVDSPRDIHKTATTTLHHLERVVTHHHHQKQVLAVAAHLHRQLSALIASAPHNATKLGEVRRMLLVEQQLLESHHGEATALALAASRHLTRLIVIAGLPTTLPTMPAAGPSRKTLPTPSHRPTSTPVITPKPHASVTPPTVPTTTSPSKPRPKPSSHHHHHHHKLPDPLVGVGILASKL